MDLEKTADEYLKYGPSIKFVHIDIYIDLPSANDAHQQRRYALDHIESQKWMSSHSSGESPTLSLELEKNEPSHCHELARLPMPTNGRGTPPDPGGHTALALVDPRFVPPS